MAEDRNEQDEQTLFVRGISEEVDEEILFELFQNVSEMPPFKWLPSQLARFLQEPTIGQLLEGPGEE